MPSLLVTRQGGAGAEEHAAAVLLGLQTADSCAIAASRCRLRRNAVAKRGTATPEELSAALRDGATAGTPLDLAHIKSIMAEYDTNKDGQIDFDEFMAMMRKGAV